MIAFKRLVLILGVLIFGLSHSHLMAWSTINGITICTAANGQVFPTMVSDGSGGAIITWTDYRNDTTGKNGDIYAQRVNSMGNALWTSNGVVICNAGNDQDSPTIVSDGAGGAIITWEDRRNANYHIYAQRVDSTGNTLWTSNGVAICTATGSQNFPVIVSDVSGGAVIIWYDSRNGNQNIYAQRVNSMGSALWTTNGVALCTLAGRQWSPALVSDVSDGAIITWYDYRNGRPNIYAQRVDFTGNTLWTPNGIAICTAGGYGQSYPTIASDNAGGAIITWMNQRNGLDIYAQRVNSMGSTLWTPNGVAICTAANDQDYPTIVSDGTGGAIIAWQDDRSNVYGNIYAQRVNSTGNTLWTLNGVAICTAANIQNGQTLVSDGSGGAIITWQDDRNDTTGQYENWDVYAQRVNSLGKTLWTANGVAICNAANDQESPKIVSDGSSGAIITWQDFRNGSTYNIYAQSINGGVFVPVELFVSKLEKMGK